MISISLAKLSTAPDTHPEETKFTWTHEYQDLVVIIDNYGASGPQSQFLKVVQGTRVRVRASASPLPAHGSRGASGED